MKRPLFIFLAASLTLCVGFLPVCLASPATYHIPYLDRGTGGWATESRQVPNDPAAVINSLLAGPASPELYTPFPAGTRLLRAVLSEGVLQLDFSGEFDLYVDNNDVKMSHAIRETAFQIPGVTAVEILVEGRTPMKGPHVEFDQRLEKPGVGPHAESRSALRWRFVNPAPWNDDLHDIVFAEGRFTAVGRGGAVLTSADGVSWAVHRTGTSAEFWNIAYGDGTYVVAGGGGGNTPAVALSSDDGIRWTQRIRFDNGEIRDVSYGDGRFVAWGFVWPEEETERVTLTSVDGVRWEQQRPKTPFPSSSYSVDYVEGCFFALGGERITGASRDGLEWESTPVDAEYLFGLACGGGKFVAVGGGYPEGGVILTSNDGAAWTRAEMMTEQGGPVGALVDLQTMSLKDVAYGGGRFVAVGNHGTILTSTDGLRWTLRASGVEYQLEAIDYGNGMFVAVGEAGTILTSRDGIEWTSCVEGTRRALSGVAYGAGRFVAVGQSGRVAVSEDGASWSMYQHDSPGSWSLGDVVYGMGRFFATRASGHYGWIVASTDGASWSDFAGGSSGGTRSTYSAIAYGRGCIVAAGSNGGIASLSNTGEREEDPSEPHRHWWALAYGMNQFVGLAWEPSSGTLSILSSQDGVRWTSQPSVLNMQVPGITYGDGRFVAVSVKGSIVTSDDGITWTEREPGAGVGLQGVAYGRGLFVAVGGEGTILTSPDGVTWTRNESGTSLGLWAVTYGEGRFVAVGANGTILTADTGEGVFADVPAEAPACEAIESLAKRGVVSGFPDGSFKPEAGVTRGELAKMLVLATGLKADPGASVSYSDVQGHWSVEQGYLQVVTAAGALSGYPDGTFRPEEPVTRAELVKTMAAIAGLRPGGVSPYADVRPADWFAGWVASAVETGIIGYGWPWEVFTGERFLGNQPATRAETALALANLVELAAGK
ncbi:MAG: S-layer homology domain-containing protein [Ignavibacteriales bacterium]